MEEQLQEASQENSRLENLVCQKASQNKSTQENLHKLRRELIKLKAEVEIKNQQQDFFDQNNTQKFTEITNNLKSDLSHLKNENDRLVNELSQIKSENEKIEKEIIEKNEKIEHLENNLIETRSKAIFSLTNSIESPESLKKFEEYEKKRANLKDTIIKDQQKISSLEASIHELQVETSFEIKEANNSFEKIQTELFKLRTYNETTKHEIELIRSKNQKEIEEIEKTYQNQLNNEKKMNDKEIERLLFQIDSNALNNEKNINLLKAQTEIDQLLIKKAELTTKIEGNKSIKQKSGTKPLVTLIPAPLVDSLYQHVEKFDGIVTRIGQFFGDSPFYRLCIAIWFIFCNLCFVLFLFKI
ncbi:hypothetical protein TRFO_39482 [Tritrichomonas foetus]|uniref:Uncharacterized protein n=1 Tax=Tritrichomonas foetus TaxID=1144522 RepID=A0A1J4J4L7_9EUKA|nr:hypothetical protein TRFO_39482 [Tritrichomonas foetus]|eukprot:OHS94296.1 hypothetical protein TRFO_39482 [Tritrichomonas foetus]